MCLFTRAFPSFEYEAWLTAFRPAGFMLLFLDFATLLVGSAPAASAQHPLIMTGGTGPGPLAHSAERYYSKSNSAAKAAPRTSASRPYWNCVPAGINNIVGLQPSLGLISTHGVVPACRTLDCVSVFALTVDDAWAALGVMAGPDAADSYSRNRPVGTPGSMPAKVTLGVPLPGQRLFFGDKQYEAGYNAALDRLAKLGCAIVEVDIEPFYETARLLYDGPWVAERTITARSLLASAPDARSIR